MRRPTTKVRTRLVLAFAYILVVLLIALGIPLTVTLQRRAAVELENQALIQAQGIAAFVDPGDLDEPQTLQPIVVEASEQVGGRVIIVDGQGTLQADSEGTTELGTTFDTPGRPEIGAALAGESDSQIRDSLDEGHDIIATAVPILDEGEVVGAVRITRDVQQVNDNVRNVTVGLLAIGVVALFAGLVLAFGLAESLSRPLRRLVGTANRLGEGDLSARTGDVHGAKEIEDLSRSFDEMAGRLERSVQAQREFVANASHQLRTPLTAMKLRLESVTEETTDPALRERLEAADREVDRLSQIVDRLLVMAREIEEGTGARVDLGVAVARAIDRWEERAGQQATTLVGPDARSGAAARGDATDIDQILDNLIDNAITYARGEVSVEAGSSNGRVFVAVSDRGPGIDPTDLERVTERFYRGRDTSTEGSGLGLSIARQLAEKWGGVLQISTRDPVGTRVEIRLPPAD